MGLFSRKSRTGPADLTTLWEHVGLLPDPLAYDEALLGQFVTRLDRKTLKQFLWEWQQALDLLATPAHAAAVQPWPWRGEGKPFSVRRFQLARERTVLAGAPTFAATVDDPGRLSETSTGEPLASEDVYRRVHGERRPERFSEQIERAARAAGLRVSAAGTWLLTEEAVGLDTSHYDFTRHDPELHGFDLSTDLNGDGQLVEQTERRVFNALERVGIRLYDACRRPTPHDLMTVYDADLTLIVSVGDHWDPVEVAPDWQWPEVLVCAADLAPLHDGPLADALTAIVADAVRPMLVDQATYDPLLVALRDQYVDQVPTTGRKALGLLP